MTKIKIEKDGLPFGFERLGQTTSLEYIVKYSSLYNQFKIK